MTNRLRNRIDGCTLSKAEKKVTDVVSTKRILVADDDPNNVSDLTEWLEGEGYEVMSASDGTTALRLFFENEPALTILDLRMDDMGGFQLVSRIWELSDTPTLVLSALGHEDHMVRGLDLTSDQYVVKPVSKDTFLDRVKLLLGDNVAVQEQASIHSDSELTLNFRTHEAFVRGRPVHLLPTEFRLLSLLVQNDKKIVSQEDILKGVWRGKGGSIDSLKWYVSSLRKKLGDDARNPRQIVTIRNLGYCYVSPDQ